MKKFVFIIFALVVSVYLFSYAKEEQHTTTAPKVPTKTEKLVSQPLEIRDARVHDVQNDLMIVGYYKGLIDGKMGPLTKKAIEDFQKANNLKEDGRVGKKTRVSLRVQAIQKIQTVLKNVGYYTAEIDGKMGPLTKKAIRDFQKDNNLQVDGKVGPKTWDKLSRYLNDLQGCLSIYNKIHQIMDDEYYKDVSREKFEKFIDEVKSVFNQNKIWQQNENELDNFKYNSAAVLVNRLKDPQDHYSCFRPLEEAKKFEQSISGEGFVKKEVFLKKTEKPGIFCIEIKSFNERLLDDLNEIFNDLGTKPISGIILDFRGNQGGRLEFQNNKGEMIYIIENLAGYFIAPGNRLYYVNTKSQEPTDFFSKESKYKYYNMPLIGLMNKSTASAAELILGVLKTYNRIILVGQNSQGAGCQKKSWSFIEDRKRTSLELVTSLFYLSNESTFDNKGLNPDPGYEILDNEQVLSKAVDILVKRKGGKRDTP